jgi:Domain of unknown function (DUF397)
MTTPLPTEPLTWIKSSHCYATSCLEMADGGEWIFLRDSKAPHVHLRYTREEIHAFLQAAKRGEFDHLGPRRE